MGRIRGGVGSGSNSSPWIEIQAEASRIWTYRIEQHISYYWKHADGNREFGNQGGTIDIVEHCPKCNQKRQTLTEQLVEVKIKLNVMIYYVKIYCKEILGNDVYYLKTTGLFHRV